MLLDRKPLLGFISVLTFAFWVDAPACALQVSRELCGELLGRVGQAVKLDCACGELTQGGGVVGQVLHETHHQRVVTEAELERRVID